MPSLGVFGTDLASRPEDMSVDFLSNIFGPSFYSIIDFVPSGAVKVMFDLFGALNSFALVVLVFTTIFFTASAVIGTAHEGKVLGEKLHSFWVPVRLIGAAAFLVPVKHGLCLFQIVLLLTIGVSIQCANKLFEIYIDSTYQETVGSSIPISKMQIAQDIADAALSNLTYLAYFRAYYGDGDGDGDWKNSDGEWKDNSISDGMTGMTNYITDYSFNNPRNDPAWYAKNGYSDLMGTIKLECGNNYGSSTYTQLCYDQAEPIQKAIDRIKAEIIPAFTAYAKGEKADASVSSEAYNSIVTELARGLEEKAKIMHDRRYQEMVNFTGDKMALFKRLGWASAGSVYHTMSNVQAELVKTLQTPITVSKGNHWTNERFQLDKSEYQRYKKQVLSIIASYKLPQAFREGENATIEDYFKKAGWNSQKVIEFIQWLAHTDNTMEAFSTLGHWMLDISFAALGIILGISWLHPGVGQALSTMSLMFCSPLIVSGALLAYYVPAIPFLIWTAGLIGWFIVVIEALVAAPLWVLGISRVDGGEGFLGQSGRSGLFLFLSVLTRPFGMLLGLCVAMTVMTFVDKLLIGLFSLFIVDTDTTQQNFEIPFVSIFVYLFILSATRTTFVHKIFGLVSYLPDVLVSWIGASGQHLSDKQDEQTVSGIVSQSAGHLALASQSTGNAVAYKANAQARKDAASQQQRLISTRNKAAHEAQAGQQTVINNAQTGANTVQTGANTVQTGANRSVSKGNTEDI